MIGMWQPEVLGDLGVGGLVEDSKGNQARDTEDSRGGGRRPTWARLVSQKLGRREMVRMEKGPESKEGKFLPGEDGVTGL